MYTELTYQIALTMLPNIGSIYARKLTDHFGTAAAIFSADRTALSKSGLNSEKLIEEIQSFKDFSLVEKEIAFIEKYNIKPIFYTDKDFPQRLLNCYDPPVLLYYKGNAPLNEAKIVSIIGTRKNTAYGKKITEEIVEQLAAYHVLIVSGLAFGIDGIAHQSALNNGLNTIGVMGCGLQTIYPSAHRKLAADMAVQGGLLTELTHDAKPDKFNFPRRNRIVAGMADATIVIETSRKGGSMITAEIANGYGREVFAVPGRTTDEKSSGCNLLIQTNRAQIFTGIDQFLFGMGWGCSPKKPKQQTLHFAELPPDEQKIVDALRSTPVMHIDELFEKTALNTSALANAILSLELSGNLLTLPGKMYQLV